MSKQPFDFIVWTDASVKDAENISLCTKKCVSYCGYGVAILNTKDMTFTTFGDYVGNKTIAHGELWAIYRGIEKTLHICGHKAKKRILVVTDNKLAVNGFSIYLPTKWDTSKECWMTMRNTPVKNQAVYKKTLKVIQSYPNVKVRIAHMHGHVSKQKEEIISKDLEKHGIRADAHTVQIFREMNSRVDEIAKAAVDRQIRLDRKHGPVDLLCRTDLLDE